VIGTFSLGFSALYFLFDVIEVRWLAGRIVSSGHPDPEHPDPELARVADVGATN
jgi:hypothetical protein